MTKGILLNKFNQSGSPSIVIRYTESYEDHEREVDIDVEMERFERMKKGGYEFFDGKEVKFNIVTINSFPYRVAWIENDEEVIDNKIEEPPKPQKKLKKKIKVTLLYSGFKRDKDTVICDGWECSSNRYFYFYDRDEYRNTTYLKVCPTERTIVDKIEEIEVEVDENQ